MRSTKGIGCEEGEETGSWGRGLRPDLYWVKGVGSF